MNFPGGGGSGPPSWPHPPNKSEHFKLEFHDSTFELTALIVVELVLHQEIGSLYPYSHRL